jgi:hypothetical protein
MAKLTAALVIEKLREFNGNFAAVARAVGVGRTAVCNFVRRRPQLQEVAKECREEMKDNAESALYRAVINGEAWAVCFYLKTQAKDRGYIERTEHDLRGEVRQRVVEEVVDANPSHNGAAVKWPPG